MADFYFLETVKSALGSSIIYYWYFGRKSSQDSTQKTCFRCGGGYPHTAQCSAIGKTCNHCHKKSHLKEFADKSLGRIQIMGNRWITLLPLLPSLGLNLILILKSLQYRLYFLTFLIIKRYLLRKTRQKSHLSNKLTMTILLLSKLTLAICSSGQFYSISTNPVGS